MLAAATPDVELADTIHRDAAMHQAPTNSAMPSLLVDDSRRGMPGASGLNIDSIQVPGPAMRPIMIGSPAMTSSTIMAPLTNAVPVVLPPAHLQALRPPPHALPPLPCQSWQSNYPGMMLHTAGRAHTCSCARARCVADLLLLTAHAC